MDKIESIPQGGYCYTIKSIDMTSGIIHTNLCPFYESDPVRCALLDISDDILLEDQVKICGINDDIIGGIV